MRESRRQEQEEKALGPDCKTCIHREECEAAQDGHFCPSWQSRAPEPKGEDPNDAWARGDDVEI